MENSSNCNDEPFLRWRIGIEEDEKPVDDEEYGSEQLLKTVVRTSYLYHLRQSLRKNLEASKHKDNYVVDEAIINKVIKGCSALLEEKALRYSMIAKLYQRVMAQTIKEVKRATTECNLYSPLKFFAEQQSKVPEMNVSHKEVQTDMPILVQNQITELYNTTDALLKRLAKDDRNIQQNALRKHTVQISEPTVTQSHVNGSPTPNKLNPAPSPQNGACSSIFSDIFGEDDDQNADIYPPANVTAACARRTRAENHPSTTFATVTAKRTSTFTGKPETTLVLPVTVVKASRAAQAMHSQTEVFENKLKRITFAESVAMWYNLECEIEELSPKKRQKLEEKYVKLFGLDHAVDYYHLTDEQKSIACRKRIAKYVVMALTNFYVKNKIASKQLFKTMAKHITSILLGRSLFPDPDEIKRSVEEFFIEGRVINSEEDFYF